MNRRHNFDEGPSVLASLRDLIPLRPLEFAEALHIAELQALRLLELTGVSDGPVPTEAVSELPRIQIRHREIPTSGLSYWDGQCWIICLNRSEPITRQRFTLFHEYKHIIDHGRTRLLYGDDERRAEQAADYFAGCVLLPRPLLKRAWAGGVQRPSSLAALFDVSERAVAVRLAQVGLSEPRKRCDDQTGKHGSGWPSRRYYRALSASTWQEVAA
jgi:Zn-dependent peptidase ImmA (M78 family)